MRHYGLWLQKYERRRKEIIDNWAGFARLVGDLKAAIPEEDLFCPMFPTESAERMAFVDGGEGMRELLGVAVFFIRASGFIHSQEDNGELFIRELDMNVMDYDDNTKERVELLRDCMEFDVALRCGQEERPDIIVLDGSLFVKAMRKPLRCMEYEMYRKKLVRLLRLCKSEKIRIVGVSEDSKSRMLAAHLSQKHKVKFPKFMTDSTILRILSKTGGWRTPAFNQECIFESNGSADNTLKAGFKTAYMQPHELANPLRIDVPDWEADMDGIVSIMAGLCRGSGHYGYPIPLYLAHLDACIPPAQMDWTLRQIVSYVSKNDEVLGNAVMKTTRRNDRPG